MTMLILFYAILAAFSIAVATLLVWPHIFQPSARRHATWMMLLFPMASAGLYALTGTPDYLWKQTRQQEAQAEALQNLAQLEQAAAAAPDSAEAWNALGSSYLQIGRPGMAVQAYKRQVVLSQGAPEALLAYGKAQVLASGGKVTDEAAEAFRMALLQKKDAQASLFLAMHAAAKGEKKQALSALDVLIKDSDTPEAVRKAAQEQKRQIQE